MFESLDNLLDSGNLDLPAEIQDEIAEHLEHLHTESKRYFPKIPSEDLDLTIHFSVKSTWYRMTVRMSF